MPTFVVGHSRISLNRLRSRACGHSTSWVAGIKNETYFAFAWKSKCSRATTSQIIVWSCRRICHVSCCVRSREPSFTKYSCSVAMWYHQNAIYLNSVCGTRSSRDSGLCSHVEKPAASSPNGRRKTRERFMDEGPRISPRSCDPRLLRRNQLHIRKIGPIRPRIARQDCQLADLRMSPDEKIRQNIRS